MGYDVERGDRVIKYKLGILRVNSFSSPSNTGPEYTIICCKNKNDLLLYLRKVGTKGIMILDENGEGEYYPPHVITRIIIKEEK